MKETRNRFLRSRRRRFVTGLALIALVLPAGWFARGLVEPDGSASPSTSVSMLGPNGPVAWAGSAEGIRRTFTRTAAGTVTGVKFKAVAGAPTKYLASIWTPDGDLLGWAATKPADSTGWMTAGFSQKVAIKANAQYTLVYWASPRSLAPKAVTGADVSLLFTKTTTPPPPDPTPTPTSTGTATPTPTPTGTGTPTPTGTGSGARNCAVKPSACGYPDSTNTGVPAGISLKPSGSVNASKDGQVVQGLDITGEINVTAPNVVIKNVRVTGGGDWVIVVRPGADNLTIMDSELRTPAGTPQDIACLLNIGDAAPHIIRADIHSCSAGVSSGGGIVEDSYIHDMSQKPGLSHDVGVASNGSGGMTVRHNTILNQLDQTAAVAFYQDFGVQRNNLVQDNLLAGGGYCVYGGTGQKGGTSNIRFIGNRFSRLFNPDCGHFGVVADFAPNDPGNAWSGNYWDDTLQAVSH
jgi:hypothetical protein